MQHSAAWETNMSSDRQETSHIFEINVHYSIHNSPPFRLNPVHSSSYNLILFYHLHLSLPSGLFPSAVHTKSLPQLQLSICAICPSYLIIFHLLTPLTFAAQYTQTCPQLYLQMNRVMWHTVTTTHHKAIPNSNTVLLYYCCKVTKLSNKIGQINKNNLFHNSRLQSSRFMYSKKERSVVQLLVLLILLLPPTTPPPPTQQQQKNYNNNKNNSINYYYYYYHHHHYY